MINSNEIRPGTTFQYNNNIYICLTMQHNKTARAAANIKLKMKNLRTGSITTRTFGANEKFEKIKIWKIKMQYLYNENEDVIFMNNESYEQVKINKDQIKWELNFIKESGNVDVRMYEQEVLGVELPVKLKFKIIEIEAGVKGNTSTNILVKAKIETGFELQVPGFLKQGDIVEINTLDGAYCGKG